ncbi:MAG: M20/M25/M40 family metallo-hydrolase [Phycisphaerae bacterium]
MNPDFSASVQSRLADLIAFRHDLHAHPETSFEETRTSSKVLERLRDIPGLDIRDGLAGGTGICATLNAEKSGPCVLLRADMDALPIEELSDLPYKSEHPGRCTPAGTTGIPQPCSVRHMLSDHADALAGPVKFCFQPAEEQGCGGQRMIDDGILENPHVDAAFALHGWPRPGTGAHHQRARRYWPRRHRLKLNLKAKAGTRHIRTRAPTCCWPSRN